MVQVRCLIRSEMESPYREIGELKPERETPPAGLGRQNGRNLIPTALAGTGSHRFEAVPEAPARVSESSGRSPRPDRPGPPVRSTVLLNSVTKLVRCGDIRWTDGRDRDSSSPHRRPC